jgi:hypothetical protein
MTPKGMTAMLMSRVMAKVPKIAGKMPPSVLALRGSSVRKTQMFLRNKPTR